MKRVSGILFFIFLVLCPFRIFSQQVSDSIYTLPLSADRVDTLYYQSSMSVKFINCFDQGKLIKSFHFDSLGFLDNINWYDYSFLKTRSMAFYLSGKVKNDLFYKDNMFYSGTSWYSDGVLEAVISLYKDTLNIKYYYASGGVKKIQKIVAGIPLETIYFCDDGFVFCIDYNGREFNYIERYCNGKIKVKCLKKTSGYFCGKYRSWHLNGNYSIKGKFASVTTNGQISATQGGIGPKIGFWLYYNEKGVLVKVEKYHNGVLTAVIFDFSHASN